mmetsp:Transcript_54152/g.174998  ORF Transcript_54152/g.174998 Transcript_54152/m.174998 type:complete len:104 (+) Transcript_54152:858-1169(+)
MRVRTDAEARRFLERSGERERNPARDSSSHPEKHLKGDWSSGSSSPPEALSSQNSASPSLVGALCGDPPSWCMVVDRIAIPLLREARGAADAATVPQGGLPGS